MAHDVFISHSSKDKTVADATCAWLEARGIRCWVAPRDIRPGASWGSSIISAIRNSRVMILIFSSHANASPQIKREVERAVNFGVAVIPMRIEDVLPEDDLEYFLGMPHWLNAFSPPLESHLDALANAVNEILAIPAPALKGEAAATGPELAEPILGMPASPPPATSPTVEPPSSKPPLPKPSLPKPSGQGWLIGAGVAVVVLVLGGLGYYYGMATPAEKARQAEAQARGDQGSTPSENARRHFVRGTALFESAKTPDDFFRAINEFKQAADLAPSWPEARYNLALTREAAGNYASAIADLKLYQQFKLSDAEARKVQDKIYALEAKVERPGEAGQTAATPAQPPAATAENAGPAAASGTPKMPGAGQEWTNSLGMPFVPAGTNGILFSIWDVRKKDFRAYALATGYQQTGGMNVMKVKTAADGSRSLQWELDPEANWEHPGFEQTPNHPVVGVSWDEAMAFCQWLTKKEQGENRLGAHQMYRLPKDAEWSAAVGNRKYPWGDVWPPPERAGNYADQAHASSLPIPGGHHLLSGNDGYARTSPVGSFRPNSYGLYDMGGDVWQWCLDWYQASLNSDEVRWKIPVLNDDGGGQKYKVLRGASWRSGDPEDLLSFSRIRNAPGARFGYYGFRVVVVVSP